MSRGERKAMIARDHPGLSLSRQCQVLAISRSSFYYAPKGESADNLALMRRIDELFMKHPFYGSRQMVRQLRRDSIAVGRHRVRRLMRLMGLEAIYQAPRTSDPHPAHRIYPYLLGCHPILISPPRDKVRNVIHHPINSPAIAPIAAL